MRWFSPSPLWEHRPWLYLNQRLGSLLALGLLGTVDEGRLTLAMEGAKRKSKTDGVVDRPKGHADALLSLKRSSAELVFSPNRRAPSNGMSIRVFWTSPEKPVVRSQAWRQSATKEVMALPRSRCPVHTGW